MRETSARQHPKHRDRAACRQHATFKSTPVWSFCIQTIIVLDNKLSSLRYRQVPKSHSLRSYPFSQLNDSPTGSPALPIWKAMMEDFVDRRYDFVLAFPFISSPYLTEPRMLLVPAKSHSSHLSSVPFPSDDPDAPNTSNDHHRALALHGEGTASRRHACAG